jgi:hypothetical protein
MNRILLLFLLAMLIVEPNRAVLAAEIALTALVVALAAGEFVVGLLRRPK